MTRKKPIPEQLWYQGPGQKLIEQLLASPNQASDIERCLRLLRPPIPQEELNTAEALAKVFWTLLGGYDEERTAVATVDNHDRLIEAALLTTGSHRLVVMDIPHVLRWVLTRPRPVAGFAVAHNHPSGNPKPSAHDHKISVELREGAKRIGVDFVDHIIVASADSWFSFQDELGIEYLDDGKTAHLLDKE